MKKRENLQNRSSFFIVGKHPVIEALKNPNRKVLRVFLTEESKKTIHRTSPHKNLLKDQKVYFKTKKELDKYTGKDQILHQGFVAEVEHLNQIDLKSDFREGFCNLGSSLIYENYSSKLSKYRLKNMNENTDPDYGIGFRKMKSMLDKIGWKRLLKKLPRL